MITLFFDKALGNVLEIDISAGSNMRESQRAARSLQLVGVFMSRVFLLLFRECASEGGVGGDRA